jgi:hypothetical protein
MRWLLEQWNDIKGNAKWALTVFVMGLMASLAIILTRGPALWQMAVLAVVFVLLLAWGAFMTAAYQMVSSSLARPQKAPDAQEEVRTVSDLDDAKFTGARDQILSLTPFELFALWQLLEMDGMTGEQFANLARQFGIPAATQSDIDEMTETFAAIHKKSPSLLAYDQTSERWEIRAERKDYVEYVIIRSRPVFGI